ncbi:aminotransferase-like domain-containing protein [Paenirhodobacter populi]|uniref:PLP-dependent aminotransferase family protein n=1 Tax=Paenirhodobacter populi TaxID=2306993 RepID=A0A443ISD3_9RHOB|nr:PLP-dependent aminotransferase family protein [Sinirhodobacter populi]RWR09898.1 PLP-dependent aminotransferase family protein [Sinirhodobacter populi]RWR10558.1 PLP-dependent aminotransferase family protein [Sinirhodobacter populi]
MTDTSWKPDLSQISGPKYLSLVRALRDGVRRGDLSPGSRLPTVRDLAWKLGVTPGTVARAYQIATQEGLLEAAVGRGTFVSTQSRRLGPTEPLYRQPMTDPEDDDGVVDLRSPQLPDVGQVAALKTAMVEATAELGQQYLEYPGLRRDLFCREAVIEWFRDCAIYQQITADDLVLTLGGQNGINIVMQCCLRGDRPVVFCEELAYPGFRHAARLNRAEVVAVALDGEGMVPAALDAACRRYGGQMVCVTPDAQNPTTARMSTERRRAIVDVARRHDLQIIEDDCYTAPVTNVESLRKLGPERTWHVTSLSKTISAGMRFGIVVAPEGMGEAGRLTAQHSYFGLPRPVTDIVTRLFRSGEAMRLRHAAQAEMARRLQMVVQAFGNQDLSWQEGLSFVWLRLPTGWRASTFARMAESEGVLLRSADEYVLQDGHAPNAVRIALAGGVTEERFQRAIGRLTRLLNNPPGDLPV